MILRKTYFLSTFVRAQQTTDSKFIKNVCHAQEYNDIIYMRDVMPLHAVPILSTDDHRCRKLRYGFAELWKRRSGVPELRHVAPPGGRLHLVPGAGRRTWRRLPRVLFGMGRERVSMVSRCAGVDGLVAGGCV